MSGLYLTALEIKHLAQSAGFEINDATTDEDLWDAEHWIGPCPEKGVMNDEGVIEHYNYVTTCEGCEGNECTPLGFPVFAHKSGDLEVTEFMSSMELGLVLMGMYSERSEMNLFEKLVTWREFKKKERKILDMLSENSDE